MTRRKERARPEDPAGSPAAAAWGRRLGLGILAIWLASELLAGAALVRNSVPGLWHLASLPREVRQAALLSRPIPIAADLERLGAQLPRDARVFLLDARLEEYYLAVYALHPRTVLVDEPSTAVSGVRGEAVGRVLAPARLGELGVTHLVAVDPSHRSLRESALAREKHD